MTGWQIASVFLLVAANGFFVAAEFGLVAVRRTRIAELAEDGHRRAQTAQKSLNQLNLMLSGCQLGITSASLGLGWIGEPAIARVLTRAFRFLPGLAGAAAAHGVAVAVAFAGITFLHVALGEQVPKYMAIAKPEATALLVAGPIRAWARILRPIIWAFNETAAKMLALFGIGAHPEQASVHTPDELAIIIEESTRGGAIEEPQSEILSRTLEFPDKRAVEAMVPRLGVESLPSGAGMEEVLDRAEKTGFSRFAVWDERPDEFVGVVYLKDMLRLGRRDATATVRSAMREPLLVPESLTLEEVLKQMRRQRTHFAVVFDEFGSSSGIITMEDILEELVGQIRDEYDVREGPELRRVRGGFRIPGSMRPDELSSAVGLKLPQGDYETVAGFILERLGRIARRGDEVGVDGWTIKVAAVRKRRIMLVDLTPPSG